MTNMNRRDFVERIGLSAAGLMVLQAGPAVRAASLSLASEAGDGARMAGLFATPPFDCGPWVYWFWLDVNVTRAGITADMEAMKAVGVAGVLIMDVDQGTPPSFNGAKFGDAKWYELFKFACQEAHRLGLHINMTNDAGWCGSGGPWVTPELSMQRVVWSDTAIAGGRKFNDVLPQPQAKLNFYRDIAVLAFPTPAQGYAIGNLKEQTDVNTAYNIFAAATWPTLKPGQEISRKSILNLTRQMDRNGRLTWTVPAGKWTVLRLGHTTTGVDNHPAPAGGLGLETDKLSRKATIFQFNSLMERIIRQIGPLVGKTLVSTHIDSWETGSQNWTPTFAADFKKLRGYDLTPYLPVFAGLVVESLEVSERFLWDVRQTVGDLLVENYAAAMRQVARKHGLRLSIEGYFGEPASDIRYGGQAVEPMSECWSWPRFGAMGSVIEMTSAGHVYGHNIIGQETCTADANEKWQGYPAVVKDICDWTLAEGINRFVFHRYAMQPWTNPHYAPGMSMGPWGLHYERTQTWWYLTKPWHEYVARCCWLLRHGHFVADVCYMQAEGMPRTFSPPSNIPGNPPPRPGYNYDGCPAEVVRTDMEYKAGFLTLPGGMRYRVLVLSNSPTMRPELLKKIKLLVDAGATVIGPQPQSSPSLSNFPHCDSEVQTLAAELWGTKKIITGKTAEEVLSARGIQPDFACDQVMVRWTHRQTADMDIYFVANGEAAATLPYAGRAMLANCAFRISGVAPELWNPETGTMRPAPAYRVEGGRTHIPLVLGPKESVFVVFRNGNAHRPENIITSASHSGKVFLSTDAPAHVVMPKNIRVLQAIYGKPGQPKHLRNVTAIVQKLVAAGHNGFPVVQIAAIGGDPDPYVVKTLDIKYEVSGRIGRVSFQDGGWVWFPIPGGETFRRPALLEMENDGNVRGVFTEAGRYQFALASGRRTTVAIPSVPRPISITGPWRVAFPAGWGAPAEIHLQHLIAWNKHPDAGVRYFSGTAEYRAEFMTPAGLPAPHRRIYLDLGEVAVMAQPTLNGHELGILWKPPFKVDVTAVLQPGRNQLRVRVTNLWINRMIGDEQLPPDCDQAPNGHLRKWPQWLLDGKPSPTGRFTFTTWRLWGKTDPLAESGLIGPVQLIFAETATILKGNLK